MTRKPRPAVRITVIQPHELAAAIDKARGKKPRARWINETCAEAVGYDAGLPNVGKPKQQPQRGETMNTKRGFTLVEMLIALGILLILSALTLSMVNVTADKDRIRSASRDVQAYLEGARNQAIYAKQPRGVRFLVGQDDKTTATAMVYVGATSNFSDGTIFVSAAGPDFQTISAGNRPPEWDNLLSRDLITDGVRIKIPKDGGDWYTMSRDQAGAGEWRLTKDLAMQYRDTPQRYDLELLPAVLPFQEPKLLPARIAIDLDNSKLPTSWGSGPYSRYMDVMFSPRGSVMGPVGALGRLNLVLADTSDTNVKCPLPAKIQTWSANTAYGTGEWVVASGSREYQFYCMTPGASGATEPIQFSRPIPQEQFVDGTTVWYAHAHRPSLVVSLTTQTGNAASYPIHETDPFLYAETGEVAR